MKRANFHAANTVLMFEGGGMRASYTAAMASLLLEQNITFGHVCGISAGSSHTVNYLSGDIWRTRASFTDLVMEPEFGGAKTFAQGKGMFSAHWIYEEAGLPEAYCRLISRRLPKTQLLAQFKHLIAIRANRWFGTRKIWQR